MNKKSQKLQTRDFISVGIFSLIYSAVAFIIGGIAQMTPITFPFMPMIVALFTGTVFMLYIAKIPKRGLSQFLELFRVFFVHYRDVLDDVSSFFVVFRYYRRFLSARPVDLNLFKRNMTAYCLFALSPMGAYVPMAIMPAQFDEFMSKKGDVSSFAGVIDSIGANWWAIPAMLIGTILCAFIGGFIGKKLLKKHFEKAGIV